VREIIVRGSGGGPLAPLADQLNHELARLLFGLALGFAAGHAFGLVVGLTTGPMASMAQTAWSSYMLARGWLAFHHHLPWPLMGFLADGHQRGVLRQVGAVYQFRRINLQHRLATRPETEIRLACRIRHVELDG
jgi:hypothetical protein